MKSRRARLMALLGGVLAAVVLVLAGVALGGHPSDLPSPLRRGIFVSRSLVVADQALNILTTRYYRPLDRSTLVGDGLSGMVAALDDPYSHYLNPRAYRERDHPPPSDQGAIGISTMPEPDGLRVLSVVEHSPAAGAGLRPADLITKVGSTSLADRAQEGGELIRGPVGTQVQLTFRRNGREHEISLQRAHIVIPVASWRMVTYRDVRIGYLRLTRFPKDSGDELRSEVRAALDAHARGLILDLRGNGGGLIDQAVTVASIFLAHGEILSAQERDRPRRVYMARGDAIAPRIPMVVLVNHGTASSAEIVTAALKDHGRAEVIGTRTYGKGVFQTTEPLTNGGALDITVGRFFTPDGHNLGGGGGARPGDGITPNIEATDNPRTPADEALGVAERTVAADVS